METSPLSMGKDVEWDAVTLLLFNRDRQKEAVEEDVPYVKSNGAAEAQKRP